MSECQACGTGVSSGEELEKMLEQKQSGCPDCGSNQFRRQEGCNICPECGYSKCK